MSLLTGLWQFDHQIDFPEDGGRQHHEHFSFYYGGDFVILRLESLHPTDVVRDDDFYKLKAKMDGNILSYLLLDGVWQELAEREEDWLVNIGSGKKRFFKRIMPEELAKWNLGLLKTERPLEQYEQE